MQLPPITASYKKRKLVPEARSDTSVHSETGPQTLVDDVNTQPLPAASTTISTTPNSQRSTQSPPRYIPPHLQEEVSEASYLSNSLHRSNASTTGSSPTDAYANLTLGSNSPTIMADTGNSDEQDTNHKGSTTSPTTPIQARLSTTEPVSAANLRSSSPAKRPAATLEEDQEGKNFDIMDIDRSSPLRQSHDSLMANADAEDVDDNTGNAPEMGFRAASVDMLAETQTDSQLSNGSASQAASTSPANAGVSADGIGSAHKNQLEQDNGTVHEERAENMTTPSLDEQVARIHQLYNQLESTEGVKGYVLSGAWYRRVVAKTTDGQKSGEFSKEDMEAEIGPIDNSDLIEECEQTFLLLLPFPLLRSVL